MRNIKLTLQYMGTHYLGWQIQPQGPTIQGILEDLLEKLLQEKVHVIGSGRTDTGVHALGQVASFKTINPMDTAIIHRALNGNLPSDIGVLDVKEVPLSFHPVKDAMAKTYGYFLFNSPRNNPFLHPFTKQVTGSLNLDEIHPCLEMLVGEHDFAAFKASDSMAKNSRRTIHAVTLRRISLQDFGIQLLALTGLSGIVSSLKNEESSSSVPESPSIIAISIKGRGFLKHMMRNIVGTLLEVGKGKIGVDQFRKIMESRDRTQAGMTAPAKGLFLIKVDY